MTTGMVDFSAALEQLDRMNLRYEATVDPDDEELVRERLMGMRG